MKKVLFLISIFILLGTSVYAQVPDFITEIKLYTEKDSRERPIGKDTGSTPPATRSITLQPAYAYIYNNVVTVTFEEAMPSATITLVNTSTGETVYSETHSNPTSVNIDLDAESSGEYQLEIISDETCLQGSFVH